MGLIFSSSAYELVLLVAILFLTIYIFFKKRFNYWADLGVPVPRPPIFPVGNFKGMLVARTMTTIVEEMYKETKNEKFFGFYFFIKPILVIKDLELVKNVLVKDFSFFRDRGVEINHEKEPLLENLFLMRGQKWRNLRAKLTPTFTSSKMKFMFPTFVEVGKLLTKVLEKSSEEPDIEIKEILSCFSTDVIASVAFGLNSNSLENPDDEFRLMGRNAINPTLRFKLANLMVFCAPKFLIKHLPLRLIPKKESEFFFSAVKEVLDHREKNNIQRNDFMQLLFQLKSLGYIPDVDNKEQVAQNEENFTIQQAAAQAFIFFLAGFEPTSAAMQFAFYELAINPDIQIKLQKEIDTFLENHNGTLTYECISEMEFLDRVVAETLRKYPLANFIVRECLKDYLLPNTNLTIKQGQQIWLPLGGYHFDPEHYPDPEKFDPDRFLPEVKEKRNHYAYLPFGEGPRSCIGNRFALMQVKVGVATVLSKFTVSPSTRTLIPMVIDQSLDNLAPKGRLYLKVSKRNK